MKKITLLLAAVMTLGFAATASAVCVTAPEFEIATDGTPEGTFAIIYWNECDGETWQVCTKGGQPSIGNTKDAIQPYPCTTIDESVYHIPFGGPTHVLVRWLDGNHAGTRHLIDFDWPTFTE